jgi:hypothetical protein
MFKYVAMIAGLIIMCVPEDAGFLRFFLQGGFGLTVFGLGVLAALDEQVA